MKPPLPTLLLAIAASAVACDYQGVFELRNETPDELSVSLSLSESYSAYDCSNGKTVASSAKRLQVTVAGRLCFGGRVGGEYEPLDDLEQLTIIRRGTACIAEDGSQVRSRFVKDGFKRRISIDEAVCPIRGMP